MFVWSQLSKYCCYRNVSELRCLVRTLQGGAGIQYSKLAFDGVGNGSDTFQLEFSYVLRPGSWFQVVTIDYIDTGRLQTLLI